MKLFENYDLTSLNTFGVTARAKFFSELNDEADLRELLNLAEAKENKLLFLGGGSNVLFTKDFDGIVAFNNLKGISVLKDEEDFVHVRAMGGESWHDLVTYCVERGYWGIENLSLIPGTVGAAPMQNIGAYGAELKDVLENLEAYNVETGEKKIFKNEECVFGYRDSVFKNNFKGKYFISAIVLRLGKVEKKNTSYRALSEYLEKNNILVKSSKDVSDAVAAIRKSKLPDPAEIGNAGSFFKNVFIGPEKFAVLKKQHPEMPAFEEDGMIKIPAAWLIEQSGWKGKRVGNVGVHERQALVLVNYGGATGLEIKELSDQIVESVREKFDLKLDKEINII